MPRFLSDTTLKASSWQAWERTLARLLPLKGWKYAHVVGASGDRGADVIASLQTPNGATQKWVFQSKAWKNPVGPEVLEEIVTAIREYNADKGVIVSKSGFTKDLQDQLRDEAFRNILSWDMGTFLRFDKDLENKSPAEITPELFKLRESYQEPACQGVVQRWLDNKSGSALVVMATGLGKTFVGATAIRRIINNAAKPQRILVIVHINQLLIQLERAFWPFLRAEDSTIIVNGEEKWDPYLFKKSPFVFASRDTLHGLIERGTDLGNFDVVLIDECHHAGTATYDQILEGLEVGIDGGPFLIGLTATDWRPDGAPLEPIFGDAVARVDMVDGLRQGFLTQVDYRMYTDNIDWEALPDEQGGNYSPKQINKTLFIDEWDDAVVEHVREAWIEIKESGASPKAIVFCGTIQHAEKIAAQINSLDFAHASTIHSGPGLNAFERNKRIWDFTDGRLGILCAVDVLNEGIDVPDVNLVVFQRVTHSRRIFIQQLGRGLRISEGKDKVIVLDFVHDVRRFAAGLNLQKGLSEGPKPGEPETISIGSKVSFKRANSEDLAGEQFLKEWLGDYEFTELEGLEDNQAWLNFPSQNLVPDNR